MSMVSKEPPISPHFNQLTPAEQERLANLAQQASEMAAMCNKIIRHGWQAIDNSVTPSKVYNNRQLLTTKIRDTYRAMFRLTLAIDIDPHVLLMPIRLTNRYMHHQQEAQHLMTDTDDNPSDR